MKDVEERNVPAKIRRRALNILAAKLNIFIMLPRDLGPVSNFARIQVHSENGLRKAAFPQIKTEQPDSASDIQDRLRRGMEQLPSGTVNLVPAQLAAHVAAQPTLPESARHPGAGFVVPRIRSAQVFHLLRIIALPD